VRKPPYQWIVATTFVLALFMDILDLTIVNVSLFDISKEFNTSLATTTWIVLGYSLSLALWIPVSGWVGDRFGARRTFMFALCVFVGASVACGEANSISQLIVFRAIQGIGGGMLTPTGVALLYRAYPPAQRAKASAVLAIPTVLAPASGPVLGGWLTDSVGWRWIFRVNVPVGLVALAIAFFGLKKDDITTKRPFDVPGVVLTALSFPALVYALERGAEEGWLSGPIIAAAVVGVTTLIALVWWSLRTPTPLLDLRLLHERLFRASNIISFVSTMAFLGVIFLLPQFLQRVAGFSASEAGLATFPQAFGVIISSRIVGKVYAKIGPRRLMFWGYVGLSVMTVGFVLMSSSPDPWTIRIIMFARGLFLAFTFIPLQAASYARISPEQTGRASALFSTQRQLGAAVGVALLSTVLLSAIPIPFGQDVVAASQADGFTTAFHWAFAVAALLTLAAAGLSLLVKDEDAAATMKPKAAAS
jgi:EmrB/QacA subfamily drug resistance transporter